jgi:purine nucleosidase
MGGAWQGRGNQTSAAEFNIAVDPESAHAVFARSPEIWLAPWEAALAHGWPYERMARVFRCNTRRSQFLAQMTEKIAPKLRDTFRLPTFPCPDPLAMALVLDESVVAQSVRARIHVDIAHGHGRGLTTLAYRDAVPNTTVMTHVDEAKFFDMLEAAWS